MKTLQNYLNNWECKREFNFGYKKKTLTSCALSKLPLIRGGLKMKYNKLAKDIIKNIGGKENVNNVVHCVTRLRFHLKDEEKANTEVLKNMDGIVTVRKSSGQYQVVIGNHVGDVHKAVVEEGGFHTDETGGHGEKNHDNKESLLNRFIDTVSGIFVPILGVLATSGMIKGFNAMFIALGWLDEAGGTYQILNILGDALFYFLPVILGYSAMKKFGGSPFIGMVIGMALVYPGLEGITESGEPLYTLFAGTVFESPVYIEFLGIPIILMTYSMSIIPVIISTFFAAKLEGFLTRVIPSVVRTFLVPLFTWLVIIPLTFIVIGPIATWAAQILGEVTVWIYGLSPIIAGAFIGGFWLVLVMFGLHWGIVPIGMNNVAVSGFDPVLILSFAHSFALAGVILAIWIKTKSKKMKSLSAPAFISSIFGVTEPGVYGIALPLKRPFIITLISSALGGAILGFFGTKQYIWGGMGVFTFPTLIHPEEGFNIGLTGAVIAAVVGMIVGFILTYLFGGINKQETSVLETKEIDEAAATVEDELAQDVKSEIIVSPLTGEVINLADISDTAFASGALGKGVAIKPAEGKLISPVSGTVSVLFETYHAVGIKTDDGAELLIHIGMDTVQLNGEFFKAHVAQGDKVEKGQLLIEFDIQAIEKAGYDIITPIVLTNTAQYKKVEPIEQGNIDIGERLLTVEI